MTGPRLLVLTRLRPGPDPFTEVLGAVAEAAVFSDGQAVLHWLADSAVTEFYPSEQAMRQVRERSGRSVFTEVTPGAAEMPGDVSYHLFVARDSTGVSAPDGSGDRTTKAASLAQAIGFLIDSAAAGCEYVCLEILKDRLPAPDRAPNPPGAVDVIVAGEKL